MPSTTDVESTQGGEILQERLQNDDDSSFVSHPSRDVGTIRAVQLLYYLAETSYLPTPSLESQTALMTTKPRLRKFPHSKTPRPPAPQPAKCTETPQPARNIATLSDVPPAAGAAQDTFSEPCQQRRNERPPPRLRPRSTPVAGPRSERLLPQTEVQRRAGHCAAIRREGLEPAAKVADWHGAWPQKHGPCPDLGF